MVKEILSSIVQFQLLNSLKIFVCVFLKNIFSYNFILLCVPIKDYPDKIQCTSWTKPEEEQLSPVPEQACTNLHSGNIWK